MCVYPCMWVPAHMRMCASTSVRMRACMCMCDIHGNNKLQDGNNMRLAIICACPGLIQ